MQFEGTVQEAEQLFATEYWHYQHAASGGLRLACGQYSLPEHVRQHVDFAMPTVQLDGLKPVANVDRTLMARVFGGAKIGSLPCGELVTVDCLRKLYNFPAGTSSAADNQMGIGEWADYPAVQRDHQLGWLRRPFHPGVGPPGRLTIHSNEEGVDRGKNSY